MKIIHLIGQPASGKTTVGRELAQRLGWSFASIDDERVALLRPGRYWPDDDDKAWRSLIAKASTGHVVVETAGTNTRLAEFDAITVLCHAPALLRRARLLDRIQQRHRMAVGNPRYVQRLMAVPAPSIPADLEWDSSYPRPITTLLDEVIRRLN